MISSNNDLYAAIEDIAASLAENRHSALAVDISNAISIGSLPGEILGEARLQLKRSEVLDELDKYPLVVDCLRYINSVVPMQM